MATGTLPDETREATDNNESDRVFNDTFSNNSAKDLNNAEQNPDSLQNPQKNNNSTGVQNAEENPAGWKTTYNSDKTKGKTQPLTLKGMVRKRGPIGLIILLVGGGGLTFGGLFSGAGILVNMAENIKNNVLDATPSVLNVRGRQIMNSQLKNLTSEVLSGICTPVTIRCRFSTMTKKQIAILEEANVKVNTDGKAYGINRNKVVNLEFEGEIITTENLKSKMAGSRSLTKAISRATRPRLTAFSSTAFTKVLSAIGSTKAGNLAKTSLDKMKANLKERVTGTAQAMEDAGLKTNTKADGTVEYVDEGGNVLTETAANSKMADANSRFKASMTAKKGATSTTEFFTKGSVKASLVGVGAVSIACTAWNVVRTAAAASRYLGAIQLANYATVFLNTADELKAGDATPEQVEYLSTILTTPNSEGKAAMDSRGMNNVLYGDVTPIPDAAIEVDSNGDPTDVSVKNVKVASEVTQYVNGAGVGNGAKNSIIQNIPGVSGGSDSAAYQSADTICGYVNSTTGAALMVGTGVLISGACFVTAFLTLGATGAACLGDIAVQGGIMVALMGTIALVNHKLTSMFSGTLISGDENGNQSGNAIASGAGALNTMTGLPSGLGFLDKSDAGTFQTLRNETNSEFAEIDRSDYSPLDGSNVNTFMGKMTTLLAPYLSKVSSVSSYALSISKLPLVSFSSLFNVAQATSYTDAGVCTDTDYEKYATDINCNPLVGQTQQTLDRDIDSVLDYMINNNHIDETTGTAKSSEFKDYATYCTERETAFGTYPEGETPSPLHKGEVCQDGYSGDGSEMYSMFRAFISYSVAEEGMSGETLSEPTTPSGSGAPAQTPDNITVKGSGWTLTDKVDYSNIPCATGTTDNGLYTHPTRGFTIRKCAIAGGIVASNISQKVADMFSTAGKLGINLTLSSGFRSYEQQAKLYASNCNSSGSCSPSTAKPGNSQHEAGLALDIEYNNKTICFGPPHLAGVNCHGNNGYDWLKANASTYGFYNLPAEAWHWSASGN